MNAYEWKAEAVVGGYLAHVRRVDRCEFETIRGRNGKPRIFRQRHLAENAAMRLLLSFVNIDIRSWRTERQAVRKAAETVFKASAAPPCREGKAAVPKLVRQRGRTKAVEVRSLRRGSRQERL